MKTHTLFKRGPDGKTMQPTAPGFRDRPWYFKFRIDGKTYPRCLQTNDAKAAQDLARKIHSNIAQASLAERSARLDATRLRQIHPASKLVEVATAYLAHPARRPAIATRRANLHALNGIVTACGENPQTVSTSILTQDFIRAWKLRKETEANKPEHNYERHAQLLNSANSILRQARSVFTPTMLDYFRHDCKLTIPESITKFLEVPHFTGLPKTEYNPPTSDIIAATLTAWEALEDRNLFLAIGHELAFGLRAGEIAQAMESWWQIGPGYPVLDGEAHVKNKNRPQRIRVRALDPWFTIMRTKSIARGWLPSSFIIHHSSFIISGSPSFRDDGIEREVSSFLRSHGWQTQKTNHALRAYAGSQIAMKYGIYDAQTWLRHSSVKVTESHYSYFVSAFKPANLDDIPARWAILDQTPTLTIVESAG